jgi:5'-nucleotidase (lipoprotein e(P4) family)
VNARVWSSIVVSTAALMMLVGTIAAQGLEIKYVRDSEAYAVLTRQVYRSALEAVESWVANAQAGGPWAVAIDVDETTLDNSTYQLELGTYDISYDDPSWNAWVARREAGVVPGVIDFVASVRGMGGRVAWISNRLEVSLEDTRVNLDLVGLWSDDDRLCLKGDPEYTKADRRRDLANGEGPCGWPGTPVTIAAFLGDQMGDFPATGEPFPGAGEDSAFGTRFFMLPNPMYGPWSRRVTRHR